MPFVSVIVPVLNDLERVALCLGLLGQQGYPRHLYEVIVVDNGSDSGRAIADVVAASGQALLAEESRPGSYAARNTGISLAKGEVIAFIDADCLPAADWIEQGVAALRRHPDCGLVAGAIIPTFQDPNRPTAVELHESLWYPLDQEYYVERCRFGATANLFTTAGVLRRVGVFNAFHKCCGDLEWGQRVHRAGYRQSYAPEAVVRHPLRRTFPQLHRRARCSIGGRHDLIMQDPSWPRRQLRFLLLFLRYLAAPLPMLCYNLLVERRLRGVWPRMRLSFVMSMVCGIYLWELIRLRCGAESYRGGAPGAASAQKPVASRGWGKMGIG